MRNFHDVSPAEYTYAREIVDSLREGVMPEGCGEKWIIDGVSFYFLKPSIRDLLSRADMLPWNRVS